MLGLDYMDLVWEIKIVSVEIFVGQYLDKV